MISATRARAHNQFDAVQKRQKKAMSEHEEALAAQRRNTERLREMRLAKEASDKTGKTRIKALKAARAALKRRG